MHKNSHARLLRDLDARGEALRIQFASDAREALAQYHTMFVAPVAQAVEYMMLPWWKKLVTKKPDIDFSLPSAEPTKARAEVAPPEAEEVEAPEAEEVEAA